MDYKYIEQLIDRYFECDTTIAEVRILKAFFSQNDVPAHLRQYADIFDFEEAEAQRQELGDDFDRRVINRLQAEGEAPVIRVSIQRLTLADRLRPFFRAAAAVAIIVLVGGSMHNAYVTHTIEPISSFGTGDALAGQEGTITTDNADDANLFIQQGEKVAITVDTLGLTPTQK